MKEAKIDNINELKIELEDQRKEIQKLKSIIKEKTKTEENIIEVISKNVEPLTKLISNIAEKWIKIKENESRFSIKMSILAVFVVSMIVIISAFLTYYNKIDGATFTFLLGIIVGYMLTFIREAIYPAE